MAVADIERMADERPSADKPRKQEQGAVEVGTGEKRRFGALDGILSKLASRGSVELRGSTPVPYEERTVTQYFDIFSLWFCMSCNLLP